MTKSMKDYFQYGLAALILILYFVVLFFILGRVVPAENKEAALLLLGCLQTMVGMIVGYFYGSSKGSSEKNDIISANKG